MGERIGVKDIIHVQNMEMKIAGFILDVMIARLNSCLFQFTARIFDIMDDLGYRRAERLLWNTHWAFSPPHDHICGEVCRTRPLLNSVQIDVQHEATLSDSDQ